MIVYDLTVNHQHDRALQEHCANLIKTDKVQHSQPSY